MGRLDRSLLLVLATGVLNVMTLWPQSFDTGILGTVADSSGAVVVGATVTLTQPATGTVRTVLTAPNGAYEVRYLLPGEWVVEVRTPGFQSEKSSPIIIRVGQVARLDFALKVGEVNEQVQVTAQGVLLETQSGVVGDVVTGEKITNLPLNGRSFVQLGNLTPGVIASGGAFRADGARSMYQQISFDGVTAVRNRETSVRMFPNVDAVQEFKVQSSNYSAEYGGHAGANVQLQLRSGSNEFHGTAFDFLRNDALDARAYFSAAPAPKPALRRNQFGGVLTGPISRDHTFFMVSYEGVRQRQQSQATTSVFTAAMRSGDFTGLGTTFSGTKLNEFRFGYNRGTATQFSTRAGTGFTASKDLGINGLLVGGPNGRPLQDFENGFPSISITNYVGVGDSTGGAAIDQSKANQFIDNFSIIKNRHTLKFGGDIRKLVGDANSNNTPFGNIVFTRDIAGNAAAAYMLGFPKNTQTPEGISISGVEAWRLGPYFQDDWKVSDRLTLNLGIRYDLNLLPKDVNGVSRTLLRSRSQGTCAVAALWTGAGPLDQGAHACGAAVRVCLPGSEQLGGARRLRNLHSGDTLRQRQHAGDQPAEREFSAHQLQLESDCRHSKSISRGFAAEPADLQHHFRGAGP